MITRQRTGLMVLVSAAVVALVATAWWPKRLSSASAKVPWDHPYVERDLDRILADTLRVLVLRDPLSWEQRPNATSGAELELLERFAKQLNVPLLAVPMDHPDSMYLALQQGKGDVIAAQFTPRGDQRRWMATTRPYCTVKPMRADRRALQVGKKVNAAISDTITITAWSPFFDLFVEKDAKDIDAVVRTIAGSPEEALMDVVIGRSRATVVTDAVAAHEAQRFPSLEFLPIEASERNLSFALRTNAPQLLDRLDHWLENKKEITFRHALLDTYMDRLPKSGALRQRTMPAQVDSISPYDAEFKQYGQGFGWKWQLLTAMAWKESRFDSTAVSNMGAQGIMQFMPGTAAHFGLDSAVNVGDHIHAAKRYVTRLDTLWMRAVPDRDQRLRFVLASYNAGAGHIIDAQRLAERLGLNPERWENNVECAVLLLAKPRYYMRPEMKNGFCRGSQVFHYVRDIVALYHQLTGLPPSALPIDPPPAVEPVEDIPLEVEEPKVE